MHKSWWMLLFFLLTLAVAAKHPCQAAPLSPLLSAPDGTRILIEIRHDAWSTGATRTALEIDGRYPTADELGGFARGDYFSIEFSAASRHAATVDLLAGLGRLGIVLSTCTEFDKCQKKVSDTCPNNCVLSATVEGGCSGKCCDGSLVVVACAS